MILVAAVLLFAPTSRAQQADISALAPRLQALVDQWRTTNNVPGVSVAIVHKDGRVQSLTSGVADRQSGRALAPSDLLMTGSTGKTFFAAVALQLIEAGRLDLNAPISKYLSGKPWFARLPNANDITVRMLMTHTSGLVRYEMNPKFTADLRAAPDKAWTPDEEIAYLLDSPAPFAAGKGWDYSDTNYIVLGVIMEGITKTRLYDEVQKRFLTPLQIAEVAPTTSRRIPGLVSGYAGPRDPLGLPDEVMVNGTFVINPQFEWTGGGYATSARALARWGHALYTAKAVSTKMRDLMIAEAVPARLGPETKYGLGVIVRDTTPAGRSWGHSGFFPGYQTELAHFPDLGITVAAQINSSATRGPLRLIYDLVAAIR
ncbi:MAG TPA: serine hydrolase domain-containing protein [Vicinamibacterales bacterium]|nr:serine hydrolase domain-containing protein [Vicinamibacterales bacterium]